MTPRSRLIVFEGIDGVGKTTLCQKLKEALEMQGMKAVWYEEGEDRYKGFNLIKPFIKAKAPIDASLLFYLASSIYKSRIIEKLLKKQWVLCDRYIYSTLAYHIIHGADKNLLSSLVDLPIRKPDFTFLITAKESVRTKRAKLRRHSNANDFLEKRPGNLVARMEKELKKFQPIIVDNSSEGIEEALRAIFTHLGPICRESSLFERTEPTNKPAT